MNKRVMWRTAIISLFFFLSVNNAQSQDTLIIFGTGFFCEFDCGTWSVEQSMPGAATTYIWTFNGANGFTDQITTQEPSISYCDLPSGSYTLEVIAFDPNNNIVGSGSYFFFVEFSDATIFGQINLNTDCGSDTIFVNQGTTNGACYDFCLGETYTLDFNLEVLSLNGATGQITNWSNTGGVITASMGNTGSAAFFFTEVGTQYITVEGYAFSECEAFANTRICATVHATPEPTFTTDPPAVDGILSVCDGQTIFFENTTADVDNFLWDFGDGSFSSDENPNHTYAQAGTYTVTFSAGGGCSCMGESTLNVVVTDNDSPLVDCVGTVCAGETVTYSSQTVCGTYNWTVGPEGTLIEGGGTADDFVSVQWNSGPTGTISLEVADCPDLTACTVAALIQVPIVDDNATISGPAQPCLGEVSVYNITSFAGTSYQWTVSSFGTILSGQGTPSIQVQWFEDFLPGVAQSVSVVYDNCYLGCGGADQLAVNIRADYRVEGSLEVCNDGNGVYEALNNVTNNAFVASWEVVDASGTTVYTAPSPTNAASIDWTFGPGSYELIARPDDATQYCQEAQSYQVTVLPPPPPVDSIAGQRSICAGNSYTYEVVDSNPAERYRWAITQGGSTLERFGNPIVVTWDQGGPYGLEVVRIQNPPLNCESIPTAINIIPFNTFAIAGDADACFDQLATYTTDAIGDFTYSWQITPASAGTITGANNAPSVEILWHSVGPATLTLDICGQQEVYLVTVHPIPAPVVNAPVELCPNETALVTTVLNYDAYSWQDTVGNVVSTVATPNLGPGYYRLEVTDAFGCVGSTSFYIYGHPAAEVNISTPDPNVFCNAAPLTNLFATATTDAFSYQWLRDGTPVGTNSPSFQATQTGIYRVQVTDVNGCIFNSNSINVRIDCNPGTGTGDDCTGANIDFFIAATAECNQRSYTAGGNYIPGSVTWTFYGPTQTTTAAGNNVTPEFREPGFYNIRIRGTFDDGAGGTWTCENFRKDTISMVADFDYIGACAGEVIDFFDLSTFLPITSVSDWSWDFGDPASGAANTSILKDPTHTFANEGNYTVRLTVTSTDGCISIHERILTVYPQPTVTFAEPSVNCEGTALAFNADVAATVTEVSWDFGDPASGQANASSLFQTYHAYDAPGNYTLTLNVISIYGCTNSFSRNITVTQNTLAGDIDPPGVSNICEGDNITLTSPAGGDTYVWSNNETTASITVSEAGVYSLTITDSNGCTYEPASAIVNIIPAPLAPIRAALKDGNGQTIAYQSDSITVCFGEPVYLETVNQAGYAYSWATGGFQYNTEFSEDRNNLLIEGVHDIELTVTENSTGCQIVSSFRVIVLPVPDPFGIVGDIAAACAGTTVTISIDNPQAGITYRWSNGMMGTSITVSDAGEYTAVAFTPAGCSTETDAFYTVFPGADIRLVPDGCHRRCGPDTLCVPTIPGALSYQWFFDDMPIAGPNGTTPNLIAENSGSYNLEIVDVNGCVTTSPPLTLDLFDGFGDISGAVYFDVDLDGMISAADTLVPGIGIYYMDMASSDSDSTITAGLGDYDFISIPAAMYRLGVLDSSLPENWGAYTPSVDTLLEGCGTKIMIDWLLFLDCPDQTANESFTICSGENLMYRGNSYTTDTTFVFNTSPIDGCDSVITFNLSVMPATTGTLALQTCAGGMVEYNGQNLSEGSSTDFTLQNQMGCDSTLTVQVTAYPPSAPGMLQLQTCAGETIEYNGQTLAIGSSTVFVLTNAVGCDSTVTVEVQAYNVNQSAALLTAVCEGETFSYNGQDWPAGTNESVMLSSVQGCDSMVMLTIMEVEAPVLSFNTDPSCADFGNGGLQVIVDQGLVNTYQLDNGAPQALGSFTDVTSGDHEITVSYPNILGVGSLNCTATETVNVEERPRLLANTSAQELDCSIRSLDIGIEIFSGDDGSLQYAWEDGRNTERITVDRPGDYALTITNACESVALSVAVGSSLDMGASSALYVPNAFSPNADGVNDFFEPYAANGAGLIEGELFIFDRWGGLLSRQQGEIVRWDGDTAKGKARSGVYIWRLIATVDNCGEVEEVQLNGDVMLIR